MASSFGRFVGRFAVAGLAVTVPVVMAPMAASAATADLLICEYVEGSSYNKALEIWNGTGAAVGLAAGAYNVQVFSNGAATAGTTIDLSGSLAAGDVFVLAQATADAAILAQAHATTPAGMWNGDDAVVLRRGTTILDVVGQIGFDPGSQWGAGAISTLDTTLRRRADVCTGDTDGSDAFDPSAQWDGFARDTVDGLGAHTSACGSEPMHHDAMSTFAGRRLVHRELHPHPEDPGIGGHLRQGVPHRPHRPSLGATGHPSALRTSLEQPLV